MASGRRKVIFHLPVSWSFILRCTWKVGHDAANINVAGGGHVESKVRAEERVGFSAESDRWGTGWAGLDVQR